MPLNSPPSPPPAPLITPSGAMLSLTAGDEPVHALRRGRASLVRAASSVSKPEHHALAVGVLRTHQRAGLDAVEHQMGLRVDQRLVDPVRHLLGAPQPVVIAGQEDPGGPVGGCVEELVLLAPRDAAAVLGHPRVEELFATAVFSAPGLSTPASRPARSSASASHAMSS